MFIPDPWLSGILGREAWRLQFSPGLSNPRDLGKIKNKLSDFSGRPSFISAKVSVDDIQACQWLEDTGFHIVDTNITLDKTIDQKQVPRTKDNRIRLATSDDEDDIALIAANNLTQNRFHLDPGIPAQIASNSRAQWTRSFFKKQRGDAMIVAMANDKICGFLQLLHPDQKTLVIDLIAVDKTVRGTGLGAAMIHYATSIYPDIHLMQTGTQIVNLTSIKFYQSLGFVPKSAAYVFHKHNYALNKDDK